MIAWWSLTKEAFLILRRDRVFTPVVTIGIIVALFANIASNWGIDNYDKILFDIGLAGFRMTGGAVAMLWGVRMIADPIKDRSIELRIASPSARFSWLMSRFVGLSFCLILMGLIFAGVWQALMLLNRFGNMTNLQNWAIGLLVLEWIVLGSLAMLLGTLAGFSTALFSTVALWLTGLIAPLVAATMGSNIDPFQKQIVEFAANIWNFQRFNLIDQLEIGSNHVLLSDLVPRLEWAGCVLAGCLTLAAWAFQKKDMT
jgi:Cu-processing system permease protein